jgi:cytoskeletal protein CcmA (bactofilin family)
VSIRGRVTGQVHGRQRVELLSGCRVQATLVSPKLVIEDGAFFQGDCRMGGPPEAPRGPARNGEEPA